LRVLVTSSRLPFALEEIRKLGRTGHRVYASDTFDSAPGSHSRHVARRFVTASPTYRTARFFDDLEGILRRFPVDRLLPAFEEAFFLARHRERFERHAELFAPPFETLHRLHDKVAFVELARSLGLRTLPTVVAASRDELERATRELSRFFAHPAYSRAGVTLYTNAGPLAGAIGLDDCDPTERNPFLVQPFLDGLDVCSFAVAHRGRIAAHATYVHPLTLEHSGGIAFESVEDDEVLDATRRVVEATGYHGRISLDFMRTDEGLFAIECNPRPSAGVALMPDRMYDDALLDHRPDRTRVAPAGVRRKLSLGLIRNMVVDWRELPEGVQALLSNGKDVYADAGDMLPLLYQLVAYGRVIGYRLKTGRIRRSDIMKGYLHDICWDGEPIE
jgi:hypothetical protein